MSVKVFSRFNRPKTIPAPIGSGMEPVFEERIVDGINQLVKVGENPISPMIQEYAEETKVYNILARYKRGDITALNQRPGQYIDVVGMPSTLAEAQQKLRDVEEQFSRLPLEIRQKFNNNVNEYIDIVSHGTVEDVAGILGVVSPQPVEAVPDEPVEE